MKAIFTKMSDGVVRPATSETHEYVQSLKIGQSFEARPIRVSQRSIQHHKLYFGGLLELAMQYWEPTGGLIAECERKVLEGFAKSMNKYYRRYNNDNPEEEHNFEIIIDIYLDELAKRRKDKIDIPPATKESLHEWVKREAGYFEYEQTPTGILKKTKSINFNSMSQEQFNKFYQDAFSVVWKFVLSQTFENEAQAQNAVDQLVAMG